LKAASQRLRRVLVLIEELDVKIEKTIVDIEKKS